MALENLLVESFNFIPLTVQAGGTTLYSPVVLPPGYLVQVLQGGAFARATHVGPDPSDPSNGKEVLFYQLAAGFHPLSTANNPYNSGVPLLLFTSVLNLYFPPPPNMCWHRLAEILGFAQFANLWPHPIPGPNLSFQAPSRWTLEQVPYILIEISLPHMSANMLQRCGSDLRTNFLAKVPLFNMGIQRGYPMNLVGTGVSVISALHIRILTPWHALYPMRGREWSCTLVIATGRSPAQTLCP
jgi:hypothetical protein